jgi:hypothetical protein
MGYREHGGLSMKFETKLTKNTSKIHFPDTHLPSTEDIVTWQIKHILNKLRYCIASNPQKDSLSVLNQEQTMPFQSFGCQRKCRW